MRWKNDPGQPMTLHKLEVWPVNKLSRRYSRCGCGEPAAKGIRMYLLQKAEGGDNADTEAWTTMWPQCTSCFDKLRTQILTELMNVED